MVALLIVICVFSYSFILFKLIENKVIKYLLIFLFGPIYGILLFFIGMSFGAFYFILCAILPILIGVFIRVRRT
ncbi:hypothetical protein A6K24_23215 [Metabacillus litoralis]|uniref:DUF2651 domain-containing protein n=1 Tax=Metabacillus litoralis TaxID=152268 RepID=A0A179T025_9BACI|nr:hypothetical protein A6K24_23215 [Metabacillus litoralis]